MVNTPTTKGIQQGLAFDESDCRRVISESWSRFTGTPQPSNTPQASWRSPGLFGLIQRRRAHLFKLPQADPVLPEELGQYPHFQSDFLRQKHGELVSRLLENRFKIDATASPGTQKDRDKADLAEWVLTYAAASVQQRSRQDWQRALAEGASAYCYGVLHWRMAPELAAGTPEALYADEDDGSGDYQPVSDAIGADEQKGKYVQKATVVAARAARAKANGPFPIHVEILAPDQVAFIDDDSDEPGAGIVVVIKEVGIVDYNGKLAKEGLRLLANGQRAGDIKLSLEQFEPKTDVGMERPAPVGNMQPSIAGWKQRIAIATIWNRNEFYELASPTLLTGGAETIVNQTDWVLVKGQRHGYGMAPFVRGCATVEENEWDPALRWRPAQDGIYAGKASYDYSRAMYDLIATKRAIREFYIEQDVNAPPTLAGDEEGDQTILTRDSAAAQVMPPGQELKVVESPPLDKAFSGLVQIQLDDLKESAPPTGQTPISATTQPWNLRIGQVMANAYPSLVLHNISDALVEMFRNWVDIAAKPAEIVDGVNVGGLGIPLVTPGFKKNPNGTKSLDRGAAPITMQPSDWDGIWIDVDIEPISSAERVTQLQMDQQLLNNPIHVTTPEMFVADGMGVQDATGHMREVDAYWLAKPFMDGLGTQALAEFYGKQVLVGADGVMVNGLGQQVDPTAALAQNGVTPVNTGGIAGGQNTQGDTAASPGPLPAPNVPPLPSMPATGVMPAQPGMR